MAAPIVPTPHELPSAVVMGSSLGGLSALEAVLGSLPRDFPAPIVIAHHLSDRAESYLAELLAARTQLTVQWAPPFERPKAGHVYICPAGRHIVLSRYGRLRLHDGPRYNFVRPAADLLFESAATLYGRRCIAVVLSGRLSDGAAGAAAVRTSGGVVIAQDPETCAACGMPNAAISRGVVHFVLPPATIAAALVSLTIVPGAGACSVFAEAGGGTRRESVRWREDSRSRASRTPCCTMRHR